MRGCSRTRAGIGKPLGGIGPEHLWNGPMQRSREVEHARTPEQRPSSVEELATDAALKVRASGSSVRRSSTAGRAPRRWLGFQGPNRRRSGREAPREAVATRRVGDSPGCCQLDNRAGVVYRMAALSHRATSPDITASRPRRRALKRPACSRTFHAADAFIAAVAALVYLSQLAWRTP